MKILLVNKFHYIKGGSETYYFGLGDLLEKLGHQVIYFSMQDERNIPCGQESYFVKKVDFNKAAGPFSAAGAALHLLYSREAGKKFADLLDNEKPDVIHLNIFQSQLTASIVEAAYKRHIPMIYTAHDLKSVCPNYLMMHHQKVCEKCLDRHYWHCFQNSCMKNSRAKSLLASMEAYVYKFRKTYEKISYVVTPSAFYKKKLEKAGVFRCPVKHIKNFLPSDTIYQPGDRGGDYFLYFGRLSREKGILTLIRAYRESGVKQKLYIVGTGPEEEQIRQLVREMQLEQSVLILGFKKGRELKEIIGKALCVCLPSEWYENGPYSIMEAQAMGRPVIVSNQGGLPELVENGKTGFIVKAGNVHDLARKIAQMAEAEMDTEYIMQQSRICYGADQYAGKILDIYTEVIESGRNLR